MYMAAVFAQVDRNLVCAVLGTDTQCHQRIGIVDFAGFAQDRDVVDVDAEFKIVCGV